MYRKKVAEKVGHAGGINSDVADGLGKIKLKATITGETGENRLFAFSQGTQKKKKSRTIFPGVYDGLYEVTAKVRFENYDNGAGIGLNPSGVDQ